MSQPIVVSKAMLLRLRKQLEAEITRLRHKHWQFENPTAIEPCQALIAEIDRAIKRAKEKT